MDKVRIDGIYFSKEFTDGWIIKKDGEYFIAPQQAILSRDLQKANALHEDLMRPVGENVERLLLRNSDLVTEKSLEQAPLQAAEQIPKKKPKIR